MRRAAAACGLLCGLGLSACGGLATQPAAQSATPVEITTAGLLLARDRRLEFGLTLRNTSAQMLWVSVHFQTLNQAADCVITKELEAGAEGVYLCPQPKVPAAGSYPISVAVFTGVEQQQPSAEVLIDITVEPAESERLLNLLKPDRGP